MRDAADCGIVYTGRRPSQMSTISQDQRVRYMWPSLTIGLIWIAVLVDALFGPDIVTHDTSGSGATIPSAVVFVLVAYFATRIIAKYGFHRGDDA
jgi:hypothetical protein